MISSRLIKSNNTAAGCEDIVDAYDPFAGNGVALYQLNGNANDESGNYNGVFTTPSYGTGVFGQAAYLNGSTSKIGGLPLVNDNTTASFWFKSNGLTGNRMIFSTHSSASDGWEVNNNGTEFGFVDRQGLLSNKTGVFSAVLTISTGVWYHCAITTSANKIIFYLNGAIIGTASKSTPYTSTNTFFGLEQAFNTYYWQGYIDQARFFDEALTPLEVEALYTEELCICGGTVDTLDILDDSSCIATYQLDGNANDLSGNYSGTPTNVSYGVGEFDLAGVFNGSSSKIDFTNGIPNTDTDCSFSVWINLSSVPTSGTATLFGNQNTNLFSSFLSFLYFQTDGVGISFERCYGTIQEYSNNYNTAAKSVLNSSTWYNISAVYDASESTAKIYLNGSFLGTHNLIPQNTSRTTTTASTIGAYVNSTYFNGSIDQVRMFNKALSAGEVTTLYNETACATETKATFVAATNAGLAYTTHSTGKVGWTNVTPNPFGLRGESVLYNGSHWVATGRSTNAAAYSPNGISWTSITSIPPGGASVGWNGEYWLVTTDTTAYYTNDETGATGWAQTSNGINGNTASSANNILWDGSDWLVAGNILKRINGSNPNGVAATVLSGLTWYNIGWQGPTGNVIIGARNSVSTNAYYMTSFTSTPISASISTSGVQTGVGATSEGAIVGSTSVYTRYSSNGASYTDGGSSGYIGGVNYNGEITVIGSASNTNGAIRFIDGENINQNINNIPETLIGIGTGVRFIATNNDQYRYAINE